MKLIEIEVSSCSKCIYCKHQPETHYSYGDYKCEKGGFSILQEISMRGDNIHPRCPLPDKNKTT
jgi:hypothetical protein